LLTRSTSCGEWPMVGQLQARVGAAGGGTHVGGWSPKYNTRWS
jgi:hypothetical protein